MNACAATRVSAQQRVQGTGFRVGSNYAAGPAQAGQLTGAKQARTAGRCDARLDLGLFVLLLLRHLLGDLRAPGRLSCCQPDPCWRRSSAAAGRRVRLTLLGACLARVVCDAAHKRVPVWPAAGALVEVLHNHSLLAGVAAVQQDDHLVGLRSERSRADQATAA